MDLRDRQFRLFDYIRIPFQVSPVLSALTVISKLISALLPASLVFVTADFVNTVISILGSGALPQQITRSLVAILIIVAYQNMVAAIIDLLKIRITQKLDEHVRVAITEKRARLEYRHIENNDTWEMIRRISQDPSDRMWDGFDCVLSLGETIIKIFAILIVLVGQIWWAGLIIIALSIPLFRLSLKAGKKRVRGFY